MLVQFKIQCEISVKCKIDGKSDQKFHNLMKMGENLFRDDLKWQNKVNRAIKTISWNF